MIRKMKYWCLRNKVELWMKSLFIEVPSLTGYILKVALSVVWWPIRAAITKCHRLGGLMTAFLFMVLEARDLRSRSQRGQALRRTSSRLHMALPSLYPHVAERGWKNSEPLLLYKALIPFVTASPSWRNYLSEAPLPDTVTLAVRVSTYTFGGDTSVQFMLPSV